VQQPLCELKIAAGSSYSVRDGDPRGIYHEPGRIHVYIIKPPGALDGAAAWALTHHCGTGALLGLLAHHSSPSGLLVMGGVELAVDQSSVQVTIDHDLAIKCRCFLVSDPNQGRTARSQFAKAHRNSVASTRACSPHLSAVTSDSYSLAAIFARQCRSPCTRCPFLAAQRHSTTSYNGWGGRPLPASMCERRFRFSLMRKACVLHTSTIGQYNIKNIFHTSGTYDRGAMIRRVRI